MVQTADIAGWRSGSLLGSYPRDTGSNPVPAICPVLLIGLRIVPSQGTDKSSNLLPDATIWLLRINGQFVALSRLKCWVQVPQESFELVGMENRHFLYPKAH